MPLNVGNKFNRILSSRNSAFNKFVDKPFTQKAITALTDHKNKVAVVLLECSVTGGRTYQAKKRGGNVEARERLFEESLAAIFWLFGVDALNKLGDKVIKKVWGIDTSVDFFDEKFDSRKAGKIHSSEKILKNQKDMKGLRKWIMDPIKRISEGRKSVSEYAKRVKKFKIGKYAASVSIATLIVGFAVPKINQAITRKNLENENANEVKKHETIFKSKNKINSYTSMQEFLNSVKNNTVSFKGGLLSSTAMIGNLIENNGIAQLLTIDVPLTSGRTVSARNHDERIEILFRDIASLFFYMASTPLVVKGLANTLDKKLGISTKLKPKPTEIITKTVIDRANLFKDGKNQLTVTELSQKLLGKGNKKSEIVLNIMFEKTASDRIILNKENFNTLIAHTGNKSAINRLAELNKQKIVSENLNSVANYLDEMAVEKKASKNIRTLQKEVKALSDKLFKRAVNGEVSALNIKDIYKVIQKAESLNDRGVNSLTEKVKKSMLEQGFIAKSQIKSLLKGGIINDSKVMSKILVGSNPNLANPSKLVPLSEVRKYKSEINNYVERLIENAKKLAEKESKFIIEEKEVDKKVLQKTEKISKNGKKYIERKYVKQKIKESRKKLVINKEILEKAAVKMKNKGMLFKIGYLITGLGISATFLSYIIPKTQYWITRKRTGEDTFPGVKEFQQKNQIK